MQKSMTCSPVTRILKAQILDALIAKRLHLHDAGSRIDFNYILAFFCRQAIKPKLRIIHFFDFNLIDWLTAAIASIVDSHVLAPPLSD